MSHLAGLGGIAAERSHWQHRALLLSEVIGAFAEATIEYEQLLDVISQKLAEVVGDLCSVLLASDDNRTLSVVATYDIDPDVLALARTTFTAEPLAIMPLQQKVLDTGEPLLVAHMTRERLQSVTTATRAPFADQIGMHSVLLVAMRARGSPIGVLNLVRHRPDQPPYTDNDRELAQLLADHAAVAITNARLLRRHDDALVLANEATARANHELEAFSYSVAHDLRAPLRVVDRFLTALEADYGEELAHEGRHYLSRVRSASQRMGQLIEDLLTLSRISHATLARAPTDVTDMARRIAAELAARTPERHVDLRVADGLIATADPRLLRVVLDNLLGNAWKFTSHHDRAIIEVGGESQGREIALFVRDNGIGFDMKEAGKLFLPFQRLHSDAQFEGSGIGLATVHRIVDRHGGRIWAESQPDHGTTVFFTLGDQA
jgi:signal transduction histidine kinase